MSVCIRMFLCAIGLVGLLFFSQAGLAQDDNFILWLQGVKVEAKAEGVSAQTLETALYGVKPSKLVIKLDRNQPEFKSTLDGYLERLISPARVRRGRENLRNHAELLERVARKYKVQPRFIVALWGIETDFGRVTGSFPVIDALATLAYDPRRSDFFRKELLAALHILDKGYVSTGQLEGSWAGAFGGLQFLPSVFRQYAVDFNGDGLIDIWQDRGDLFASGANYLSKSGWRDDQTWGREVLMPVGFDYPVGLEVQRQISAWQALGVRRIEGTDLPKRNLLAAIVQPDPASKRVFLVYNNFRVTLKWNRSLYYATAVGLLSDRIAN